MNQLILLLLLCELINKFNLLLTIKFSFLQVVMNYFVKINFYSKKFIDITEVDEGRDDDDGDEDVVVVVADVDSVD